MSATTRTINITEGPDYYRVRSDGAMSRLRNLQELKICTDLELVSDGTSIFVHRAVAGTQLSSLLSVKESRLELPWISKDTLRELVDYAYGRCIHIRPKDVMRVLLATYVLDCVSLRNILLRRVGTFLEKFPKYSLKLFFQLIDPGLKQKAHRQVLESLPRFQPEINRLDCASFQKFIRFNTDPGEIQKLVSPAMQWLRHCPEGRFTHLRCFAPVIKL